MYEFKPWCPEQPKCRVLCPPGLCCQLHWGLAAAQGPHTGDSLPTWVGANRSQPQPGKSQMAPPTTWTSLEAAAVLLPWAPALLSGGQGLNAIREPTLHRVQPRTMATATARHGGPQVLS